MQLGGQKLCVHLTQPKGQRIPSIGLSCQDVIRAPFKVTQTNRQICAILLLSGLHSLERVGGDIQVTDWNIQF